jgi:ribulose-5-phosphate 4-epimerase/fuculose-1-phosphate aldolase
MHDLITKYSARLIADKSAIPGKIAFAARDDVQVSAGDPSLALLARDLLAAGNSLAIVAAQPALPWSDFLVRRLRPEESRIIPRDTETRTFLHDIPFLRREELAKEGSAGMSRVMAKRKGIIVEGVGIIAVGALTVEQAYINYSSIFHATFVKYLQDILCGGFCLPGEAEAFRDFREKWLRPLSAEGLTFRTGPLDDPADILAEIAAVGRYTVERGLVDSFFGNISAVSGNTIYISQTAASLDELAGCIDPVPSDNSSTAGITASSELLAHRRIYEKSDARVILHGHPKFAVVMSMLCEEETCPVTDCWCDCPKVRFLGDVPVVAGEIGAGGLARRVSPVIAGPGKALVYGHGLFTIGRRDFEEAFRAMVEVENWCRDEYFRRLTVRSKPAG